MTVLPFPAAESENLPPVCCEMRVENLPYIRWDASAVGLLKQMAVIGGNMKQVYVLGFTSVARM